MAIRLVFSFLLATLMFSSCFLQRSKKTLRHVDPQIEVIDSFVDASPLMDSFLLPYRLRMDSLMDVVVGYSAVPLSKAQPESTMGNFMADAQLFVARRYMPQTTVSVINYGGMRIPYLSPGPITKGAIYEMMPFDNKLTILEIPGTVLRQFCQHMAKYRGWPVSGVTYQIDEGKAVNIQVDGKAVKDQMIYFTAVSDYLANGGDQCDFLIPLKRHPKNVFIREMLIDYVQEKQAKGEQIAPKIEKRVSYAE